MGAFIANFHVRSEDVELVRQTLTEIGAKQVRLLPPAAGWVSIYEQRASQQEEPWIVRLAGELSSRLKTVCVAFLVHDSDIACYWLSDQGELLDEYNSSPDYFEEVSAAEQRRVRGQPKIFLRYCRPGVTSEQIESVLRAEVVFAEDTIRQLAEFLGIDPNRAQGDFGRPEFGGGGGAGAGKLRVFNENDDDDNDDNDDEGGDDPMSAAAGMANIMQRVQQHYAGMFAAPEQTSPESTALVEAAVAGNIAEIERLVGSGTDVNAPGLLTIQVPGASDMLGGMKVAPKVGLSPLMAASSRGQAAAVQRLLELGANANESHPLYGSALHVAAQAGSPETVRLLLGAGIPADLKNRQGLTPRALIQAMRQQIDAAKKLAETMPHMKKVFEQLAAKLTNLPEAGWTACEDLLRQAGG
jgi:hypothetical protein